LKVVGWDGIGAARVIRGVSSTYDLAWSAIEAGQSLAQRIEALDYDEEIDLERAQADGRLDLPVSHRDPAHFVVAGTGLTHLGSADGRDKMHKAAQSA